MLYQPKFSFITATFNSAKTVEQTISSIASQTYTNIEHIIVDGGSIGDIRAKAKVEDKVQQNGESRQKRNTTVPKIVFTSSWKRGEIADAPHL